MVIGYWLLGISYWEMGCFHKPITNNQSPITILNKQDFYRYKSKRI